MNEQAESHEMESTEESQPSPAQVHLVHDTAGDIFVPYDVPGRGESTRVTVLRCLAAAGLNVFGQVAVYVNNEAGHSLESVVTPEDEVYVAGKLQGGR